MPSLERRPKEQEPAKILARLGEPVESTSVPRPEDFSRRNTDKRIERQGINAPLTAIVLEVIGGFDINPASVSDYVQKLHDKYEAGQRKQRADTPRRETTLPENAAIVHAFSNLQEVMDEFRGTMYRSTIERAEKFGVFAVTQAIKDSAKLDQGSAA